MSTKLWRVGWLGAIAVLLAVAYSGCTLYPPRLGQISAQPTSTILVAAATSLQPALQEITSIYTQTNPDRVVKYNFAASGILAQQIQQGAPVDVFIAAADRQMNALQKQGLLAAGTSKTLLTNQLVLVIPKQSPISLTNFRQLTNPAVKRIAIGEPRTVPAGQYATEVFKNLDILEQIKSKLVLGNNVKSVLTTVETGDVDAGIVYITDARNSSKVQIVAIAEPNLHSPIRYPISILKSSKSLTGSRQFIKFLNSKSAAAIFEKYGFGIAKPQS
ncbi:molybdate ABC transporter substrate-binding protein [Chamaesiphon sp. OTE_8_metabat_110]|uniref:molybdate ABC transporter substrate-binding protein n=1 Tax=Chamaesiphon sp. OTE_8_metabat_110 TaxID=2964696 RepID=UPI00286D6954|nr:molybdate ABC transporter substrate-binding protein [Chamaesiphon sp. OTE_8_metabat_110]